MGRQWPGLGERINQRIRELGFKNAAQFADAKGWRITYIYKWAGGTTPDRENLEKLAKDLGVHPAWLLFGDAVKPLLRRTLACLVALSLSWGHAHGATTGCEDCALSEAIRRRLRHGWRRGRLHLLQSGRGFTGLAGCAA